MSISEITGDLLKSSCDVICHQVNCQSVMAYGVSGAIKDKYPIVFEQYSHFLNNNYFRVNGKRVNTGSFLGLCQIVKIGDNKYVCNLFGQDTFGRNDHGEVYTDYRALQCALFSLRRLILFGDYNIKSIAFPYNMGCGAGGGGDWSVVKDLITSTFSDLDITIEIVKFSK